MDKKESSSKKLKTEVGSTSRAKPIQTKYISLEEAIKYIPRFDGFNIKGSIFINECVRALHLINQRDMEHLKHVISSKLVGEPAFLCFDINCIQDILRKIYLFYVNEEILKIEFNVDSNLNHELDNLDSQMWYTKITNSENIPKFSFYFCYYCRQNGHTEENHCCSLLETNKMFKILEHNRLSRHLFLNKLYLRELGVTVTPCLKHV